MTRSNRVWLLGICGVMGMTALWLVSLERGAAPGEVLTPTAEQLAIAQRERARDLIAGGNPFQPTSPGVAGQATPDAVGAPPLATVMPNFLPVADPNASPEGDAEAQASLQAQVKQHGLSELGYLIEERYYKMSLQDLHNATKKGDAQALTHLAERYLFELDGHPQAPGFQPGFNYREAARALLQDAFTLGNSHAAAMVSESYLTDRQILDAAAWNLVAKRVGDKLSADWFTTTADYQALSPQQLQSVTQRSEQIWQQLLARRQQAARAG